jgi:hypothetical protein
MPRHWPCGNRSTGGISPFLWGDKTHLWILVWRLMAWLCWAAQSSRGCANFIFDRPRDWIKSSIRNDLAGGALQFTQTQSSRMASDCSGMWFRPEMA